MNQKKAETLKKDFRKAVHRLREALKEKSSKEIVIDGTIQRFEFTFELAWKVLKAKLEFQGLEALSPRAAIKEAFKARLIKNGSQWIKMLEARNKTSHLYDQKKSKLVYLEIKKKYFKILEELLSVL